MIDPNLPPLALDYAGPRAPADRVPVVRSRFIGALRQVAMAAGLGFALFGLGLSLLRQSDGPGFMAAGGVLIGLAWKFRRGDRL